MRSQPHGFVKPAGALVEQAHGVSQAVIDPATGLPIEFRTGLKPEEEKIINYSVHYSW